MGTSMAKCTMTNTEVRRDMARAEMNRRRFLGTAAGGLAGLAVGSRVVPALAFPRSAIRKSTSPRPAIRKAVKYGMVDADGTIQDKFLLLKELGFDGVELSSPNDLMQEEVVAASRTVGLPIHGVVDSVHWNKTLSDPDPAVREEGLEGLRTAMQDAHAYGASTVLLVPAVVTEAVPYDEAYRRSQAEIRKVLPEAHALSIRIAIENVWNQFLMSPLEFARYLDEFESEWIGAYFDVGNVVTFGWPEHWIRILGSRILKLDVKEFSRRKRNEEGLYAGFQVPLGEGGRRLAPRAGSAPGGRVHGLGHGRDSWGCTAPPGRDRPAHGSRAGTWLACMHIEVALHSLARWCG